MKIRNIVTATVAGVLLAGLAAAPASASVSFPVLDAEGVQRGSITADSGLVNVCDWEADGVQVAVEFAYGDGQDGRRIAPLGGCTPAFANDITAVRGWAGDFAGEWVPVA
jgi:hypothetical protein